ncbi:MAG: hypothetical protein IKY00_02935 [Clostridia bacterium]|nr:hypothetical protein [Clostridia bacterium]
MDTKLKRYRLKKSIALVLAVITLFVSGLFTCLSVKGAFFYNQGYGEKFTDSSSFLRNLSLYERTVISSGEVYSLKNDGDIAKTRQGKEIAGSAAERAQEVKNACEFLESQGVKVWVTKAGNKFRYSYDSGDGTFYYSYDGSMISRDEFEGYDFDEEEDPEINTTVYSEILYEKPSDIPFTTAVTEETAPVSSVKSEKSATVTQAPSAPEAKTEKATEPVETTMAAKDVSAPETTTAVSDYVYDEEEVPYSISLALSRITEACGGLNYGEKPDEELVKIAGKVDYSEITENLPAFDDMFEHVKSVNFAVFYKTTGGVYSNCGVTEGDDTAAVFKKLGTDAKGKDSAYLEYYENGETKKIGSSLDNGAYKNSWQADFNENFDTLDSVYGIDDYVDRAYFCYSPYSETDAFGVGLNAYNAFNQLTRGGKVGYAKTGVIAIVSFIVALICCVYLIAVAGKRDDGTVKIRFTDKVPFIINAGLAGITVAGLVALVAGMNFYEFSFLELFGFSEANSFPLGLAAEIAGYTNILTAVFFALGVLIVTALIASIARNIRNRTFFKHTLCYYIYAPVRFILRKIRSLFHKCSEKAKEIYARDYAYGNGKKFITTSCIVISAVTLLNLLFIFASGFRRSGFGLFVCIVLNALLIAYLVLIVICFDRIASGVNEIKMGSLTCNINTRLMPGVMRGVAENISDIRSGLKSAVEQAVKDQSMKTELITNVTHDLKTPLTSVITYVDLLKREGLGSDKAPEYLNVIDEKSQKLKKLIDDLVQASKASSGAVDVNAVKLDLCEFAGQIVGEYEDELAENQIELILRNPNEPVYVTADPELTGRVFENIFSNIRKYAMKGTRAFVEVFSGGEYGTIIFKNISATPITDDVQKLKERFFTGDSSRSGEGSGLGLSIAQDLCAVQGGMFRIEADGDMFKTYVLLKKAE